MYEVAKDIDDICKLNFGEEYYVLGYSASITEIKDTVLEDGIIVQIISVIAIALIVGLIFRSISVPIVLVLVIQTAIWVNFAVPYFLDKNLSYIGYLVVSSLQLGATIDYAVLLSSRYMEFRDEGLEKKEAISKALEKSATTILVSCFVLAAAGFVEMLMSDVDSVRDMGELIGRGVLLSGLMVLVTLPALLVLLDKPLQALTFRKKKRRKKYEKRIIIILLLVIGIFFLTSCKKNGEEPVVKPDPFVPSKTKAIGDNMQEETVFAVLDGERKDRFFKSCSSVK